MTPRRNRRNFPQMAAELSAIAVRPANRGKLWGWPEIGLALGISAPTAQHLVQWMRRNCTETYWAVGTARSSYLTQSVSGAHEAMEGMRNQQRHLITRLETMVQGCATLAQIDPNPAWKDLMRKNADHFSQMLGLERDFAELLDTRAANLGWPEVAVPDDVSELAVQ